MTYEKADYSVYDIAKWFIWRNKTEEENGSEKMTILKLLKLLYYAEGCSLALNNKSLFDDNIVAWEHGPVVPKVYKTYSNPNDLDITDEEAAELNKISPADQELLEEVFEIFGQYSAWGLRNKTHKETPWIEATDNGHHLNRTISRDTIKKFFTENYLN